MSTRQPPPYLYIDLDPRRKREKVAVLFRALAGEIKIQTERLAEVEECEHFDMKNYIIAMQAGLKTCMDEIHFLGMRLGEAKYARRLARAERKEAERKDAEKMAGVPQELEAEVPKESEAAVPKVSEASVSKASKAAMPQELEAAVHKNAEASVSKTFEAEWDIVPDEGASKDAFMCVSVVKQEDTDAEENKALI